MKRVKNILSEFLELIVLILLGGITLGAAFAIYDLTEFSPIPSAISFIIALIVGATIGMLTRGLERALIVTILVTLVGGVVIVYALSYPELREAYVGTEVITALSTRKAVINVFFYVFPLTLVGIFIGKFFAEE